MKVLVEFDLTCHDQLQLFNHVRAVMHSLELPMPTAEVMKACVKDVTPAPVEPAPQQSTQLGSGITEKANVKPEEVRERLKKLHGFNADKAMAMITEIRLTFGVDSIDDMDGDQLATVLHQINKKLQPYEELPA